jgi:MscS family membrane protein
MKFIFIFISIFLYTALNAKVTYSPFVDKQIKIILKINENNITNDEIEDLLDEEEKLFSEVIDDVLINKQVFIDNDNDFAKEIFALKKIININRRAGNRYAVVRDEVKIKSYLLVKNQNTLIRNILQSLSANTIKEFELSLNRYVQEFRESNSKYYTQEYKDILELKSNSSVILAAQKNIREFNALKDLNAEFTSYVYKYKNKMYRLNKYSKYHLISFAVFINSLPYVSDINQILEDYGFSVVKILIILFLIVIIYFFRKVVYVALERNLLEVDILKRYSQEIVDNIRKYIEIIVIIINIDMIVYVYNDFSSIEFVSQLFNISYVLYFTLIVYRVTNTVASIKLQEVSTSGEFIKNDLINVGIKILNFIIIIIGLLFVLYFAGVNLTAVLSGLGIGGFAVAFAAKDTISNFFGTLSILFSDVFSQGDWIEIDGHEGVVVEIGLRVTTIRTFDNALIAIPNGTFASKDVKNWNKRTLGRRIKMQIGVKYDSSSKDIQNAVNEIREMLENHPDIATKDTKYQYKYRKKIAKLVSKDDLEGIKYTLMVHLDSFADSSINILIYCFSKSVRWNEWLETKEDVMIKIMKILEDNNLEFAFPSLSVYNENMK